MRAALYETIINTVEPEELVLILEVTTEQLIAAFPEQMEDNIDKMTDEESTWV
jgi:hypothetical protein